MAYLLKKKGFNKVTVLEKTGRLGGQIESINIRGSNTTYHIWSWYMYRKTLIPLLTEYGFQSNMVNMSRDYYQFWPLNNYSVSLIHKQGIYRDSCNIKMGKISFLKFAFSAKI